MNQSKQALKIILGDILKECGVPTRVLGFNVFGFLLVEIDKLPESKTDNCIRLIRKDLELFHGLEIAKGLLNG